MEQQVQKTQEELLIEKLQNEVDRLNRELQDFVENGLRRDLHPTLNIRPNDTPLTLIRFYTDYLISADKAVRERAKNALTDYAELNNRAKD